MKDFARRTDEWFEPDGSGGFASGTVSNIRTRRYHLLLAKANSPISRIALVKGFDAKVEIGDEYHWITSQHYAPDVVYPNRTAPMAKFEWTPWPRWSFDVTDDLAIEQEIFVPRGSSLITMGWRLIGRAREPIKLKVRLLHSGHDDSDSLQRANNDFSFATFANGERFVFGSYPGVPEVIVQTNAFFVRAPVWYRNFLYLDEQAGGRDCVEDLASPGEFGWDLDGAKAVLALAAKGGGQTLLSNGTTEADFDHLRTAELNLRRVEQIQRQE